MTHFSLFSGIGGIDLAGEWAGFKTVGQCEFADYPTKVLEKHWPDVPRWRDIHDVTANSFRERTGLYAVDLISGGFPCQPFSVAGKQKGKGDDRYLWPEMLRVIRELKPRWVLGENVPGILRIAADDICKDLERESYNVGIFDYEAAAVGAPHRRERVFFVANAIGSRAWRTVRGSNKSDCGGELETRINRHTDSDGFAGPSERPAIVAHPESDIAGRLSIGERATVTGFVGGSQDVCDTTGARFQNRANLTLGGREPFAESQRSDWWSTEPGLGGMVDGLSGWLYEPDIPRVATGIKNRVDRLKCLGNAVVPQQVYPILQAIADIENINANCAM